MSYLIFSTESSQEWRSDPLLAIELTPARLEWFRQRVQHAAFLGAGLRDLSEMVYTMEGVRWIAGDDMELKEFLLGEHSVEGVSYTYENDFRIVDALPEELSPDDELENTCDAVFEPNELFFFREYDGGNNEYYTSHLRLAELEGEPFVLPAAEQIEEVPDDVPGV